MVTVRFPIRTKLLETMLFELERIFHNQWYLQCLYKSLFSLAYYGLLRIGELTQSDHVLKAKDVSWGKNKNKIMLILFSSKTHNQEKLPQKIKISEVKSTQKQTRFFCPIKLTHVFLKLRGTTYKSDEEPFFMFRDSTPVKPEHARAVLKLTLKRLSIDNSLYRFHSFRIGRASQLIKLGYTIEEVKRIGRWTSNAVYKYIKL